MRPGNDGNVSGGEVSRGRRCDAAAASDISPEDIKVNGSIVSFTFIRPISTPSPTLLATCMLVVSERGAGT